MTQQFKALGNKVTSGGLEAVELLKGCTTTFVTFSSDEVTALCPVTGQPDWYKVNIQIATTSHSIESKSLKLYLQGYRDRGIFCEELASQICKDAYDCCKPSYCSVTVEQKSRGGVTLTAHAYVGL
jgi:7-cyano-7-deazaguanine reductase